MSFYTRQATFLTKTLLTFTSPIKEYSLTPYYSYCHVTLSLKFSKIFLQTPSTSFTGMPFSGSGDKKSMSLVYQQIVNNCSLSWIIVIVTSQDCMWGFLMLKSTRMPLYRRYKMTHLLQSTLLATNGVKFIWTSIKE